MIKLKGLRKWKKWDVSIVQEFHGNVYYYRKLYEGKHGEIFDRAKQLIENGELVDNIYNGRQKGNAKVPYVVANISKLICEVPADIVSRMVGQISPANDVDKDEATSKLISDVLTNIVELSKLDDEHWTNILHQQLDGGLVGVAWKDDNGVFIETKSRDVYYPHEDGNGVDLVYQRQFDDVEGIDEEDEFLHIYTERVEKKDLYCFHRLFRIEKDNSLTELDEAETSELLQMDNIQYVFKGRNTTFIEYWSNKKSFMRPLGISELDGQEGKQDEINWVLTRNAIVYERNGKPRIAVSKEIFRALQDKAFDRYGDESKIDHRDLEITTFDDNGKSMETIQIDITKIGDIEWVKELVQIMLYETKTSGSAIDFSMDGKGGNAQSGVAKFYDLFISIVKAERLAREYVRFLQALLENCLYLERLENEEIIVEKPDIALNDVIPLTRGELLTQEGTAYKDGIQSLYETVKRVKPNDSIESVEDEYRTIKDEMTSSDSISMEKGKYSLDNILKGSGDETNI